jgi:hypothetical protein
MPPMGDTSGDTRPGRAVIPSFAMPFVSRCALVAAVYFFFFF